MWKCVGDYGLGEQEGGIHELFWKRNLKACMWNNTLIKALLCNEILGNNFTLSRWHIRPVKNDFNHLVLNISRVTVYLYKKIIQFNFVSLSSFETMQYPSAGLNFHFYLEQMYNGRTWHDYKWPALILMSILEKIWVTNETKNKLKKLNIK